MSSDRQPLGHFAARLAEASAAKPLRLGILGGTFDPVHHGHLLLAQGAYEQHALDGVLLIPTAHPFYKPGKPVSPPAVRLAMLELAIAGDPRFAASRIECDRAGPSYTIDTLRQLIEICGEDPASTRLFLIVGADALADLPDWKDAAAIAELVSVLYARRPGTDAEQACQQAVAAGFTVLPIDQPLVDISSTAIKARLAAGLSPRFYTPDSVAAYITEHGINLGETSKASE